MKEQETLLANLACALNKDAKCERIIYESYVGYAFQLAKKYGFGSDDAADIAQEAMIIVFEKLKNYNPQKGSFKSWLGKITIHEALRQKKKTQNKVSFEVLGTFEKNLAHTEFISFGTEEVLPHLTIEQKELYTLYFEYGMNHQEVAENLDISLANSRVRVHRLVKQIKALFQ